MRTWAKDRNGSAAAVEAPMSQYRSELKWGIAHATVALAIPWAPVALFVLFVKGASVWNTTWRAPLNSFLFFLGPLAPFLAVVTTAAWLLIWPRRLRRLNQGRLSTRIDLLRGLLSVLVVLEALGLAFSIFAVSVSG